MPDIVTETTSRGWLSRLGESIKSVLVGLVFFLLAFPLLFWNEGRAVRTARSLAEGAKLVVTVPADLPAPANDGKLVHTTGEATTKETLTDPEFGVAANALKLTRNVEMYQWREEKKSKTRKKLGGGEETVNTYEYRRDWSDQLIDSSEFKEPTGHGNPAELPVKPETLVASKVTLGGFTLPRSLVDRIDSAMPLAVDGSGLPAEMQGKAQPTRGGYYVGAGNPSSPQIGDVRVSFEVVRPAPVSIVARQTGDSFEAYPTKAGDSLLMLREGTLSAGAMFEASQRENTTLTWILRVAGFFLMFLGLFLIFRPIAVVADLVPLIGTLFGAGIGIFAGLTAAVLSLVVIALAWLYFRPVLGIALLLLALVLLVGLVMLGRKRRAARAAA